MDEVMGRLVKGPAEQPRHDQLLEQEDYLRNATAVGRVLRHVAEYRGQWVAILTFSSAALHTSNLGIDFSSGRLAKSGNAAL